MISRRKALTLLSVPIVCAAGFGSGTVEAEEPASILIGTGPYGAIYYPLGNSICRLFNRAVDPAAARCVALDSEGSVANIVALRKGRVRFAIVQSDVAFQALHGIGSFAGQPPYAGLRSIMLAHEEPFTVMTRPGSGIAGIDDLRGRRMAIGRIGSGQRSTLDVLFTDLGWTQADFATVLELSREEQVAALCDGRVDAIAMAIGHPNGYVQDAIETCNAHLVPIEGPKIDQLVTRHIEYDASTIAGGIYPNHPNPTASFGVEAMLVADQTAPAAEVRGVVSAVFDNLDILKRLHAAFAGFSAKEMVPRESWVRLHPAALAYYVVHGLLPAPAITFP